MTANRQVMPDDHSELEPPLPIPNRTVKRYRADDSAVTSVKVGYRQAISPKAPDTLVRGFYTSQSNVMKEIAGSVVRSSCQVLWKIKKFLTVGERE